MKISAAVHTSIAFFCLSVSANAAFMVIDDDLVYDTSNNLYYQRNYLAYSGLTYDQIISEIDNSTVGGFTDWSLASRDQMLQGSFWEYEYQNLPVDGLVDIFQVTTDKSDQIRNYYEWEALVATSFPTPYPYSLLLTGWELNDNSGIRDWDTTFFSYWWYTPDQEIFVGSWVVSSGSSPVPEPATMILFGTAIVGLVGIRLRKD